MMSVEQHNRALRRTIGELRERIRQLETVAFNREWLCPLEFGLTRQQQAVLAAMVTRERCSKQYLLHASRIDGTTETPDIKIVDVIIYHIRMGIAPFGLHIETLRAEGYMLTPESRLRLKNWSQTAEEAA